MILFFFWFIIVCIVILFIPFPIKIKLLYFNKNFIFKIYNFNVSDKLKINKNKYLLDYTHRKNGLSLFINTAKSCSQFIKELKFKPSIKINIKIIYGLEEAAHTAMLYGLIPLIDTFISNMVSKLFNIRQKQTYIIPNFNNLYFKIQLNSIIYISLAKIIYTVILLAKYKQKFKNLYPLHT